MKDRIDKDIQMLIHANNQFGKSRIKVVDSIMGSGKEGENK